MYTTGAIEFATRSAVPTASFTSSLRMGVSTHPMSLFGLAIGILHGRNDRDSTIYKMLPCCVGSACEHTGNYAADDLALAVDLGHASGRRRCDRGPNGNRGVLGVSNANACYASLYDCSAL